MPETLPKVVPVKPDRAQVLPPLSGPMSQEHIDAQAPIFLRGDTNGDGVIGSIDAAMVVMHLNGTLELSDDQLKRAGAAWDSSNTLDIYDAGAIFHKTAHGTFLGYNPTQCAEDIEVTIEGPTTLRVGESGTWTSNIHSDYEDTWANYWSDGKGENIFARGNYFTSSFDTAGTHEVSAVYDSVETICQYSDTFEVDVIPTLSNHVYIPILYGHQLSSDL